MSAAVVTVFVSFRCPPDVDIVPLWEFGLGEQGLGLAAAGGRIIGGWCHGSNARTGLCCDPAQPPDTNRNNWAANGREQ